MFSISRIHPHWLEVKKTFKGWEAGGIMGFSGGCCKGSVIDSEDVMTG
jgi:hypothetical protein